MHAADDGGFTAIGGIFANVVGLLLVRKGRFVLPLALCAASVACLVGVAIAFKPA